MDGRRKEFQVRINQATDYAFRMVLHMSILPKGAKITGATLAEEQSIPLRFLLKIMRILIRAGIMKSFRGVDGGFSLNQDPKDITLFDVITAVEGDAYIKKCLYDPESCSKGCCGHCAVMEAMGRIQNHLTAELKSVNFADLAARETEIGAEKCC